MRKHEHLATIRSTFARFLRRTCIIVTMNENHNASNRSRAARRASERRRAEQRSRRLTMAICAVLLLLVLGLSAVLLAGGPDGALPAAAPAVGMQPSASVQAPAEAPPSPEVAPMPSQPLCRPQNRLCLRQHNRRPPRPPYRPRRPLHPHPRQHPWWRRRRLRQRPLPVRMWPRGKQRRCPSIYLSLRQKMSSWKPPYSSPPWATARWAAMLAPAVGDALPSMRKSMAGLLFRQCARHLCGG